MKYYYFISTLIRSSWYSWWIFAKAQIITHYYCSYCQHRFRMFCHCNSPLGSIQMNFLQVQTNFLHYAWNEHGNHSSASENSYWHVWKILVWRIEVNFYSYFVWIILAFNIFLYAQSTIILQLSSYQWPKNNLIEKLWNLEDLALTLRNPRFYFLSEKKNYFTHV